MNSWLHLELPNLPITLAGKDGKDAKPYLEDVSEWCIATASR